MSLTVRRAVHADARGWHRASIAAFGEPPPHVPLPSGPQSQEDWLARPGDPWGTFDDGVLVAGLRAYTTGSWFHGGEVPTLAIGAVSVAAHRRGEGLLRPLFAATTEEARERGAVISTLYPTAPGIYRSLGYELIGTYDDIELPLVNLLRIEQPGGVRLRPAEPEDRGTVERVYGRWAAAQNGPLTRAEAPFRLDPDSWLDRFTEVMLAVEGGEVTGFAAWRRGEGYDPREAVLTVEDLVTLTPTATRALWRYLASFESVVGRVRVATSGIDPALLALPGLTPAVVRTRPYMLRILDVVEALDGTRLAPVTGQVRFAVRGAGLDGHYVVDVTDGVAHARRVDEPAGGVLTLTAQGFALSYAGAQPAANLRAAGALTGPGDDDARWSALFGGRQVHIRDYF